MRRRTLNWGIHAKQEEVEIDSRELIAKNFGRRLHLFFIEPIVFLVAVYMSLVYGLVFIFLTAYAIVFRKVYGMTSRVGGRPFLGVLVGALLGRLWMVLQQPAYSKKLTKYHDVPIPEWRMPQAIVGGVFFAFGLFWFGWTGNYESVHWIVPTISGLLTGFGLLVIFLQMLNYLVDSYMVL